MSRSPTPPNAQKPAEKPTWEPPRLIKLGTLAALVGLKQQNLNDGQIFDGSPVGSP